MDPNLQHFVCVFEKEDEIKGALHYSYLNKCAFIYHVHVCESARDKGVLYELIKEALMHMQLDCIKTITINTAYLNANKSLLKRVESFITTRCKIELVINVFDDF